MYFPYKLCYVPSVDQLTTCKSILLLHAFIHTTQSSFRPVDAQLPNLSYLAESLLASYGFTGAYSQGRLLSEFQQQLKHQVKH